MLEKSQIEGLLPHQGAMFLLDRVARFDRDEIECSASSHRDPHHPLRHQGCLPAHVAIEYAAQAAGVHGGLLNRALHPDAPAQMGYLAVISNLQWFVDRLDDLPGNLQIHARRTAVTPGGRAYRVRIEHQSQPVMNGDLIIALETSGKDVA
ncbi:MAG: 3-hydroxylacyl-ACP dehydratase [Steroidobacteraceae bacterium]